MRRFPCVLRWCSVWRRKCSPFRPGRVLQFRRGSVVIEAIRRSFRFQCRRGRGEGMGYRPCRCWKWGGSSWFRRVGSKNEWNWRWGSHIWANLAISGRRSSIALLKTLKGIGSLPATHKFPYSHRCTLTHRRLVLWVRGGAGRWKFGCYSCNNFNTNGLSTG